MTFLTPILLAGSAAFLIPLLIHLFNRRRIVPVPWAAMHLLHAVLKQKKQRMQIEQWLLLLTRIAIPIVLALTLARPILSSLGQLPGLGKSSLIVLLDDSLSMRSPLADNTPATDQAKQDLTQLISLQPSGSDTQLILIGGSPRTPLTDPTTTPDAIQQELTLLNPTHGPVNLQNSFQTTLTALEKAQNTHRQILIISDFQQSDWLPLLTAPPPPALQQLITPADGSPAPQITLYHLPTQLSENLSIASAELSSPIVATSQIVALKARIQNHGKRPWQDVPIHLEADGARIRTTRISVPAEGEATLYFTHSFDKIGSHSLTLRLEGDSFPHDNTHHSIVQVRTQLPVLLIEGAPSTTPLSGALDFTQLALAPHLSSATADLKDLILTRSIEARRVKESDWADSKVIILGGVQRANSSLIQNLLKFVENGGGLLLLPAENADPIQWQRELGSNAQHLPATVIGQAHIENSNLPARLQTSPFTHPALTYFNDPRSGRLQDTEIQHWWKLEPQGENARIIASTDRNTPLLIERPHGKGLIIQSAIPLRPGWSNITLQPWFVPFSQRLVTWMATQKLATTAHLIAHSPQFERADNLQTTALSLFDPLDQLIPIPADSNSLPPLTTSGIYTLRPTDPTAATPANTQLIAVNPDPRESNLTPLSPDQLQQLATKLNATTATDIDSYQKIDQTNRFGIETTKPFLLALLALLFFEVLLQQRITAARKK